MNDNQRARGLVVELTDKQVEALAPLFDQIADMAKANTPGMLVAQVFPNGMWVGVIGHERAKALQAAQGGQVGATMRGSDLP